MASSTYMLILLLHAVASRGKFAEFPVNDDHRISVRMVGGKDALSGQFPYVGSLRNVNDVHMCGATLISKYTAVTAAHCFGIPDNQPIFAIFGDIMLYNTTSSHHNSTFNVTIHSEYDHKDLQDDLHVPLLVNDIALIHLMIPVEKFTKNVDRLLPATCSNEHYDNCVVIGWGRAEERKSRSDDLQYAKMDLEKDNTECGRIYNETIQEEFMLCARSPKVDPCRRDSGGPLACSRKDDPDGTELVGVVSAAYKICEAGSQGVYTRVSAYQDWIQANDATATPFIPICVVMLMAYISFGGQMY